MVVNFVFVAYHSIRWKLGKLDFTYLLHDLWSESGILIRRENLAVYLLEQWISAVSSVHFFSSSS